MQKKLHLLIAMMIFMVSSAMAQITTSGLGGKITADGEEIIGAHVEAIHKPSGTRYVAVTNSKGQYSINGMRVGGPYEIKVTYIGYEAKTISGIKLQLGENYRQDITMTEDAKQLSEVIVAGSKSKFAGEKTGAVTNISSEQLENMPTVNRNITDFTRLSPYGGNGMSFAGADGRTANFTINGADCNNNFGLSSNLPGGGNPISIESIEEMQVVVSPFDVRMTNFIGGGVNAITKSGTNTFKASAYVYHKNEQMRGDAVYGEALQGARDKDRNTIYGLTVGGPIIKDKLFFFVSGEMEKTPTVVNRWRASDDGVANADNYVSRTTNDDLQLVHDFVLRKYGYNTGSWTDFPADESSYRLYASLDWNINARHHLALRYNYATSRSWMSPNATSMDGGVRVSGARMSQYSMSYANSMYAMDNTIHNLSVDLNSRITDNISNQFLFTLKKQQDPVRSSNSELFPFIDIMKDDNNYISLGYELFTYNNAVNNNIANIKDDVTFYLGNHKVLAGINYEYQMADNQYMRNGTGYYRYRSLDDFLNEEAPEIVCLTYGFGGEKAPAARVQFNKAGIYAQDNWSVNDRFTLNYGVRFDGLFFVNSDLKTNNNVLKYNYYGTTVDTGKWPNAQLIVSPRVGFTWDILGDKTLKFRGGTGLFQGRLPLVFFTNMPTNSNMVQYRGILNGTGANSATKTDMSQFAGGLVTDANGKATIDALLNKFVELGHPYDIDPENHPKPSTINAVDPSFKMPQVWKTSFAIDYQLPVDFPFTVTAEGIFNKTINAACISDLAIPDAGGFARFNGIDNRPIFPAGYRNGLPSAYILGNTGKGYGWSASASVNVRPVEWFDFMAAYTHTASKELTGMPGSDASSAFTYVPGVEGPNKPRLHNSQYVTPDRFVASATAHDKCGNHYSLIYETWRGGYNYSFMTSNDMNGDGYAYDAAYIPTDKEVADGQFRFVSADDQKRFMDFVHTDSYLSSHQGQYAEAYSVYSPWVHRLDFSYKHDFRCHRNKLQLSFDIKNLLNFFNSSWGVSKYLNPAIGSEARIIKYEGVDADGYATFSTPKAINGNLPTFTPNHSIGQCWYASIGIKYMFN